MKPALLLAAAALALLPAGCARPGTGTGAPATDPLRSAPVDAALVTDDFGWVLTTDQLLLTHDGGDTMVASDVDVPVDGPRAAVFRDENQGWVAGAGSGTITVARTGDGGRTWDRTAIATKDEIGALHLAFGDARHGVLLAQVATSVAFSRADLFTTADGGVTWTDRTAPVAGQPAVEPGGRIWLAGGVRHDQLYSSANDGRDWSRAQLQVGTATATVVSPPARGLLPVSITDGDRASVALLASADGGATWAPAGVVPVEHPPGPGVAAPLALVDTDLVVAEPTGDRLRRLSRGSVVSEIQPRGLRPGVQRLTYASRTAGWAMTSSGSCAGKKQNCSTAYAVLATRDGGTTWRPVAGWNQQID